MSGVWNMERVNISSQCSDRLLPFSGSASSVCGSSMMAMRPCGFAPFTISAQCVSVLVSV